MTTLFAELPDYMITLVKIGCVLASVAALGAILHDYFG